MKDRPCKNTKKKFLPLFSEHRDDGGSRHRRNVSKYPYMKLHDVTFQGDIYVLAKTSNFGVEM